MNEKKSTRQRPTVAQVKELQKRIQELEAGAGAEVPGTANQVEEYEAKLKDAKEVMAEASGRIQDLESQLEAALEGKDHSQGEDLPPVRPGRVRFFVDLTPLHADYLTRAASREQRSPENMIERIIRIDRSKSPDKAGTVTLGVGSSMPAADGPKIPITR